MLRIERACSVSGGSSDVGGWQVFPGVRTNDIEHFRGSALVTTRARLAESHGERFIVDLHVI